MVGPAKLKHLQKIEEKPLVGKHAILKYIFGSFASPQLELFHLMIAVLLRIAETSSP